MTLLDILIIGIGFTIAIIIFIKIFPYIIGLAGAAIFIGLILLGICLLILLLQWMGTITVSQAVMPLQIISKILIFT